MSDEEVAKSAVGDEKSKAKPKRRAIPGNFTYTTTPGKLKIALQNLIDAERPDVFNKSFIETYLSVSGGSAAPIPNIMKRVEFIGGDGKPTEWYGKFQTESGRPEAALHGIRKAFQEIFKKNTFAHSLPEDKIKEIIVEITGLVKTDSIVSQIYGTFDAFRSFIPTGYVSSDGKSKESKDDDEDLKDDPQKKSRELGLSYHIKATSNNGEFGLK